MTEFEITITMAFFTGIGEKNSEEYVEGYIKSMMDVVEDRYGDTIDIEKIEVKKI